MAAQDAASARPAYDWPAILKDEMVPASIRRHAHAQRTVVGSRDIGQRHVTNT